MGINFYEIRQEQLKQIMILAAKERKEHKTERKIMQIQLKDSAGNAVPCVAIALPDKSAVEDGRAPQSPPESNQPSSAPGDSKATDDNSTIPGANAPTVPVLPGAGNGSAREKTQSEIAPGTAGASPAPGEGTGPTGSSET